jgi:dCMP deaminase
MLKSEHMTWDSYFMGICDAVAANVKCPSRRIGVVLIRDRRIVSTGYNGPPSGFPIPQSCARKDMGISSGHRLSLCPCAHAERNAIGTAAKMGHSTDGCTLYLNTIIPCLDCAYSIVNAGIAEVVVTELQVYPQEGWTGEAILRKCGVTIRKAE